MGSYAGSSSLEFSPKLRVVIVGAGLSGLATAISCALSGASVSVVEASKELIEVGAGLQISPNASRLLQLWELGSDFWEKVTIPSALYLHRYSNGDILSQETNFGERMREKYGAPFLDVHRCDLQLALVDRCRQLGVQVHLGQQVTDIDFDLTEITTQKGEKYRGDLIIGADGLWSKCRDLFVGEKERPRATGDLAYRILLDIEDISDPDLREIVEQPTMRLWTGPDCHVVAYTVKAGKAYNIALVRPDDIPEETARVTGSIEEMNQYFSQWDPLLRRFLALVKNVDKWKLMHRLGMSDLTAPLGPELKRWIHENHNFALIGDCCHPMLPYLAQGANSSLEDGAVLGLLLKDVKTQPQLAEALERFEKLRKARGEGIVREAFNQRQAMHMHDGPEQEARDTVYKLALAEGAKPGFPNRFSDPIVQSWLFGYDAVKEVEAALARHHL